MECMVTDTMISNNNKYKWFNCSILEMLHDDPTGSMSTSIVNKGKSRKIMFAFLIMQPTQ